MGKELSEMTLEELWELFPIFLVEHNRDAYTAGKTEFICKWTTKARKLYADRY